MVFMDLNVHKFISNLIVATWKNIIENSENNLSYQSLKEMQLFYSNWRATTNLPAVACFPWTCSADTIIHKWESYFYLEKVLNVIWVFKNTQ